MIIVKIFQGPGNQLFQYAYGLAASKRVGTELKLDLSWFKNNSDHRPYILDRFSIDTEIATEEEVNYIKSCNGSNFFQYRYNLLRNRFSPRHKKVTVLEDLSRFDKDLNKPYKSSCIEGYFSSELFFENYGKEVRSAFTFKNEVPEYSCQLIPEILQGNSVALSIRRGDFLKYPLHNICSKEFYQRAITEIRKSVANPKFYIFSDEIAWVKKNMKFDLPHTFVEESTDHMEHIRLMSLCKFHIIPNSTFSWWGAWLSQPDKVIAPEHWLNPDKEFHLKEFGKVVETSHTVPKTWSRIPECLEGEEMMTV